MHRFTLGVCAIAALTTLSHAQLTPPSGPVGSSMKTLDQVEPSIPIGPETTPGNDTASYLITESGSYHLTGPLTAGHAKDVIQIHAPNVTIDLRGFVIDSYVGASAIRNVVPSPQTIRNGTIQAGSGGVAVDLSLGTHAVVEDLRIVNAQAAIVTGPYALVRHCVIDQADDVGISVDRASIVDSCVVRGSGNSGSNGIATAKACVVRACTVEGFDSHGIAAGSGTRVIDCTARACGFSGFQGVEGSAFTGCNAIENYGHGFFLMTGVRAERCSAEANGANGFNAYQACILTNCLATNNVDHGIETVGELNRLTGNTAFNNGNHGIHVGTHRNVITLNTAGGHGLYGQNIWVGNYTMNFYGGRNELSTIATLPLGNFNVDD